MTLKDELIAALELSAQAREQYIAGLSDEEKVEIGTYEDWAAKDMLAHAACWVEYQATRLAAIARSEEPPAAPSHYEAANAQCYRDHCQDTWQQTLQFSRGAYDRLVQAVRAMPEEMLLDEASPDQATPLWQDVVGMGYTHPLIHITDRLTPVGQHERAGRLWQTWGSAVAPLSDRPEWQGNVHYNLACSLSMLGQGDDALEQLELALQKRPGLRAWSRRDSDLAALHDRAEFKALFAAPHWWPPLEASLESEALADQFIRLLTMVRGAIEGFPASEWTKGDSDYQRPAGLLLHLLGSLHGYCALKAGEPGISEYFDVNWEEKDSSKFPSQAEVLAYLDVVEKSLAEFLTNVQLSEAEDRFAWTGSTQLGRALYMLRHTQQHLGEICMEMHQRGLKAPEWQ